MPKSLIWPIASVGTSLREAQRDGLCAICAQPPATPPLTMVPLCRWHSVTLTLFLGTGVLSRSLGRCHHFVK
jgi:hypothetical protein